MSLSEPSQAGSHLWVQVLAAMVLGVGTGLLLSPSGLALVPAPTVYEVASWVALPGRLFLSMVKMVVIPLVMTSIITGIVSAGDPAFLKRVGARIAPYFIGTTAVATTIGIMLALALQPGSYIDASVLESALAEPVAAVQVAAAPEKPLVEVLADLIPTNTTRSQLNEDMLAVVILSVFYGVALVTLPLAQRKTGIELAQMVQAVAMRVVGWAMALVPIAVFGLLCDITIRVGLDAITGMGAYIGTVLLGLLALVAFYLGMVAVLGGMSPGRFLKAAREVQLLAFSTSSSAAVMPLSVQTAHERLGVAKPIARFIVPLGATVNMDGTALYQVCAAVFLTQVFGVEMTLPALIALSATTVGASIGAPSTPGVGIVILATILEGIGVPGAGIALILGVDRILDMSRTAVNVTGDLTACVVMNRWLPEVRDGGAQPEPARSATPD